MIFEAEVTANLPLFRIIMTSERAFYRDFCTQEMKFDTFVIVAVAAFVGSSKSVKCEMQSPVRVTFTVTVNKTAKALQ